MYHLPSPLSLHLKVQSPVVSHLKIHQFQIGQHHIQARTRVSLEYQALRLVKSGYVLHVYLYIIIEYQSCIHLTHFSNDTHNLSSIFNHSHQRIHPYQIGQRPNHLNLLSHQQAHSLPLYLQFSQACNHHLPQYHQYLHYLLFRQALLWYLLLFLHFSQV